MPHYLLFAFDDFYPAGGLGDLVAAFVATDDREAVSTAMPQLPTADSYELVALDETTGAARTVAADLAEMAVFHRRHAAAKRAGPRDS